MSHGRSSMVRGARRVVAWLVVSGLVWGCGTLDEAGHSTDSALPRLWPAPPELPRFIHEATLRRPSDVERVGPEERLRRRLTGQTDGDDPAFLKPGALVARHGKLYVADTVSRLITVFDLPRRKVFRFGFRSPGQLLKPSGLALDGQANLYVADATQRLVQVYDHLGLYLKTLGDPRDLERPVGVAVNAAGTRVYVVDRANNESVRHRVVIYDGDNRKLGEIGGRGDQAGRFNVPLAAAMGPADTLHVLDAGNFRVQVFDARDHPLRTFGGFGTGLGNFARPRGLAVDDEGNTYVTDASFGNFQIFNAGGELLLPIGRISRNDAPGRYALISGIAVDDTRRVYVADQFFNKIEVFRRLDEAEARRLLATY